MLRNPPNTEEIRQHDVKSNAALRETGKAIIFPIPLPVEP
jgi:hypothetical protein